MKTIRNIDKYKNSVGQIWVNVASSTKFLDDAINMDNYIFLPILNIYPQIKWLIPSKYYGKIEEYIEANKQSKVLRHDCRKPLPFPHNSIDHILCSHFLEHVYYDEMMEILKDFYQKLKAGGTVHIILPDLQKQCEEYVERIKRGDPGAADHFIEETLLSKKSRGSFKYQRVVGLQHHWMYDQYSIVTKVLEV